MTAPGAAPAGTAAAVAAVATVATVAAVDVRMYCGLLGDCFLLTVTDTGGGRRHILIDCGVLQGTPGGPARMERVAADIAATCRAGGRDTLDLAVVTHEHWDHVSGFAHARDTFAALRFDQLWLAWTEDPADADGRLLRERFGKAHRVIQRLGETTSLVPGVDAAVQGLFGFSGPLAASAATGKRGTEEIYDSLRAWAGTVRYLSPGMVVEAPGGLRTYVLAPPREQKALFRALDDKETYLAADAEDEAALDEAQRHSPFSPRFRWKSYGAIKQATRVSGSREERWLAEQYFGPAAQSAAEQGERTRRQIDDSYALQLNRLALRMDRNTNNSSLVLAFELPGADRPTMLFAADAQVGNWLSWGTVRFTGTDGGADRTFDGHDLLARARLYKVGHHGSHNATMKAQGLELMLRDDLVAMIPTDAAFALTQGKGWQMPNPRVSDALREHARGGVLRGDRPLDPAAPAVAAGLVRADPGPDRLWIEYRAYGEPWSAPAIV